MTELNDIGQFIILIISGGIIPLLLVLYKSRCKRICFGCIERDVLNAEDDKKEKENLNNDKNEPESEEQS